MEKSHGADVPLTSVLCRRVNAMRTAEEHAGCAYCFGGVREVASGERARFCDFEPGRDPVAFGFPDGTSRDDT